MKEIGDIKLYTVLELAGLLDTRPVTLRKYLKEGRIKARKHGNRWLISQDALREYFQGEG
jgi:excisionase family DNA binding protein